MTITWLIFVRDTFSAYLLWAMFYFYYPKVCLMYEEIQRENVIKAVICIGAPVNIKN